MCLILKAKWYCRNLIYFSLRTLIIYDTSNKKKKKEEALINEDKKLSHTKEKSLATKTMLLILLRIGIG